ncbi:MAG: cohesin domain-containing protein, partial [Archaeoglobaceae archaeon]|nr:cohesin domain-containing protein [Archaeoglobaceae archaeon]MDW8128225.1 cohesin domain-containing protein [Archaeoglobaceae archaeon]
MVWISIFLAIAETWQSYDKNGDGWIEKEKLTSLNIDLLEPSTQKAFKLTSIPLTAKLFIEPNKTTVAPGERFAVDISLQDGTTQSALVNFTFDPTKITYVSGSTQRLFNFMDRIDSTANYVRYLGTSTSPVSIATKTKVATAVFSVNPGASETISFSIVTASIDGTNASAIVQRLTIVKETWQAYDRNGNGDIEDRELIQAILDWLNNKIGDRELINVILKWLQPTPTPTPPPTPTPEYPKIVNVGNYYGVEKFPVKLVARAYSDWRNGSVPVEYVWDIYKNGNLV